MIFLFLINLSHKGISLLFFLSLYRIIESKTEEPIYSLTHQKSDFCKQL